MFWWIGSIVISWAFVALVYLWAWAEDRGYERRQREIEDRMAALREKWAIEDEKRSQAGSQGRG